MVDVRAILETAIGHHRQGDFARAQSLYERALASNPEHCEALYLSGTALLQLGRFAECICVLEKVVSQRPDIADASNNLGVAYQAIGRWDDAVWAFELAIRAQPDYEQAYVNLGALWEKQGLADRAEVAYRKALSLGVTDSTARFQLGNLLKAQGRNQEAERCYREFLVGSPDRLDARVNLGFVLVQQERLQQAADVFQEILAVRPDYAEVHANLSYVLERQGKMVEAVAAARRALDIRPDYAEGWNNLGIALRSCHQLDEAEEAFHKALELAPDFALADFNHSTTLLLAGRYREGWPGYARHAETLGTGIREFSQSRWNGQPLPGKKLLVYADQGFGDTIQFVRFLLRVKQRSQAHVILECQPKLKTLLANCDGVDGVIAAGDSLPSFDAVAPLAELPAILDVELKAISARVPYLHPPNRLCSELETLLGRVLPNSIQVGLAWQGNPRQARDFVRSCPLKMLLPLFAIPRVSFVSLQTDDVGRRQLSEAFPQGLPSNLLDAGELLENFSDAALMTRLDLILTVDTATAHLAGALGRPVWTMLCHTPDWRWHLNRTDSPWYPTMRLFRQPRWGDWDAVVTEVARELNTLASRGRSEPLRGPHTSITATVPNTPRSKDRDST